MAPCFSTHIAAAWQAIERTDDRVAGERASSRGSVDKSVAKKPCERTGQFGSVQRLDCRGQNGRLETYGEAIACAGRVLHLADHLARPDLDHLTSPQARHDALGAACHDDARQTPQDRRPERAKQGLRIALACLNPVRQREKQVLALALVDDEPVQLVPLEGGELLAREHRARVEQRRQTGGVRVAQHALGLVERDLVLQKEVGVLGELWGRERRRGEREVCPFVEYDRVVRGCSRELDDGTPGRELSAT